MHRISIHFYWVVMLAHLVCKKISIPHKKWIKYWRNDEPINGTWQRHTTASESADIFLMFPYIFLSAPFWFVLSPPLSPRTSFYNKSIFLSYQSSTKRFPRTFFVKLIIKLLQIFRYTTFSSHVDLHLNLAVCFFLLYII